MRGLGWVLAIALSLAACAPATAQRPTPATAAGRILMEPASAVTPERFKAMLETAQRRALSSGVADVKIEAQGAKRILLQKPGITAGETERLAALLTPAGQVSIRLVDDDTLEPYDFAPGESRNGLRLLASSDPDHPSVVVVDEVIISNADFAKAEARFDPSYGWPVVEFQLTPAGRERFGAMTKANVGRRFAIVCDDKVLSAPMIHSPITFGFGQITGSSTMGEAQTLARILVTGAMPVKLNVIEIGAR